MIPYEETLLRIEGEPRTWLVTGCAGFIGSHLTERLLALGQRVVGLDNFSTGSAQNLSLVKQAVGEAAWKGFRFVAGDIRSLDTCQEACHGVDLVLHQAALGSVPRSIDDPVASGDNNIAGFLNMLVAARDNGARRFVYASSSAVYGDHPGMPKVEHTIGRPLSPYGLTKQVNELYAGVFAGCYGVEAVGLRYFNVFGPRQNPDSEYAAVIAAWIGALLRNQTAYINGDGNTARDFCYVDNVVQANLLAATTDNPDAVNQVYNVALGEQTSLTELFEMIRSALALRMPHLRSVRALHREPRRGDLRYSLADTDKAARLLGYRPTHRIAQGLEKTVEWYAANLFTDTRKRAVNA